MHHGAQEYCLSCSGCDEKVEKQLNGTEATSELPSVPLHAGAEEVDRAQLAAEEAEGARVAITEVGHAQIAAHQHFRDTFSRVVQQTTEEAEHARIAAEKAELLWRRRHANAEGAVAMVHTASTSGQ